MKEKDKMAFRQTLEMKNRKNWGFKCRKWRFL